MSVTEIFANQPFTTVPAGASAITGSDTWTVSTSAPFPDAQTGLTQFHVCDTDPTASSEIILVTNVTGNTWSVTRGAEGTTPVSHQPGFTVTQVLTAGWLTGVTESSLPSASAGALLYGNPAASPAWLAGNTTSAREFLSSTGAGGTANSPAWGTLASADIPNPLNQNTTGTAGNVSGIVAVLNGGTGNNTATSYAIVTGGTSATTPFQQVASLGTAGQALTSNGAGALPSWQQTFTGLMEPLASPVTAAQSPYAASAGQYVPVDTTSGNVTITMPSGPGDKAVIGIKHVIQGGTNAVYWNTTGGAVINKTGGGTQGSLPLLSQGVISQYAAGGTIWYVYSDDLPLSQLDLRYLQQAGGTVSGNLAVGGTITSGTWGGSTITVPEGGTGDNSFTAYAVVTGGTASTAPLQAVSGLGSSGQVLTSNGAGSLPSWQPNVALVNPMTTHGDMIYESAGLTAAALAGNTGTAKNFLTSTGSGGTANSPAWGTIAASDVPVLNQNTTGTAGGLSTILAIGSGGTGQATQQAALNAIAGGTTPSGDYLRANGTNVTLSALQAADLTGNVSITHGGTGAGNAPAAITALTNPQTAGDYLRSDGTNSSLQPLQAADLTGTVAVLNGGTGGTSVTAYAVVTGGTSATTALQAVSGLGTSGQSLISNGAGALPTWQTPAGRILNFYRFASTVATFFPVNSTTPAPFGAGTIGTQPFTAPPSGNVLVTVNCMITTTGGGVFVAMFLSPNGSATTVSSDIIQYESPSAGFAPQQAFPFYLTGLTPGTTYNFDLLGSATSGQAGTIVAFTQTVTPPLLGVTDRGGPVIITVTAL